MGAIRGINMNKNNQEITLYYYPDTRAAKVRWMLEELGLKYHLQKVDLPNTEHRATEHLKIHPLGKAPALKVGNKTIIESLAICLYLAENYQKNNLIPELSKTHKYYQWILLAVATLEPAIFETIREQKQNKQNIEFVGMGPGFTQLSNILTYLNDHLENRKILIKNQFSTADLMVGSLAIRVDKVKLTQNYNNIHNWVKQLTQRQQYINTDK